jgi:ABC-type uncharacterized transport system fused permease/ATPase subunit
MHEVDTVINEIRAGKFEVNALYPKNLETLGEVKYEGNRLELKGVPVMAPNGEIIIEEVNMCLEQGDHCFIDGPNGSGKSSVFRIMSELWQPHGGQINFPGKNSISFIP